MSAIGVRIGRPSRSALDLGLEQVANTDVTYDYVGSTLHPEDWPERAAHVRSVDVAAGAGSFDSAKAALRDWACHRGIWATVHPADAAIAVGTSLLIVLPAGPFSIVVPDRIVAVVDEPDRFGFAYGTLPGHQERGEEAFLAERRPDGVRISISVDATTATAAATAIRPIVVMFQRLALDRYLHAWRDDIQARSVGRG